MPTPINIFFRCSFYLCFVIISISPKSNYAQKNADPIVALPFNLSPEKRLSWNDINAKKEGADLDILPQAGYENLTGFNYGIIGSIFNNGKRKDSLFNYADYRLRLDFAAGGSYKNGQSGFKGGDNQIYLKFDAPYVFKTPYHLSCDINIENNPYNLYYGVDTKSLFSLASLSNNDPLYNYFKQNENSINLNIERMFLNGFLWVFTGIGYAIENISSGQSSLLNSDFSRQSIFGVGRTTVPSCRIGLRYDSRDRFENPKHGLAIELTKEYTAKFNKGSFRYDRIFFHFNYYSRLRNIFGTSRLEHLKLPCETMEKENSKLNQIYRNHDWIGESVFAFRYAFMSVNGTVPFYAYQNFWSSEDNLQVLGGDNSLRGFAPSRFAGKITSFINIELRVPVLKIQHIHIETKDSALQKQKESNKTILKLSSLQSRTTFYELGLVPFVDIGGVWNSLGGYFNQSKNYRVDFGAGLRVIVNSNFVIRFDYAVSKEDQYAIIGLSQAF